MSFASLLSIKVTSPITHMVSSAVRGVLSSVLGMWIFHDVITGYVCTSHIPSVSRLPRLDLTHTFSPRGRASSIATILFGSLMYTWVKHQESQPASKVSSSEGAYDRLPMDVESMAESKPSS